MKTIASFAVSADRIHASLGGRAVLHDVKLRWLTGRWLAVVGPNGAGKSTLLRVLAGLMPHTGQVTLLGQAANDWPVKARAQAVVWLGQGEGAATDLTVWDVAMLGRLPHQTWLSAPTAADDAAVTTALNAVQAWDWRHRRLGQLSGGERQRVLLARALATEAQLLLMDEPLANLDPPHQADWVRLVRQLVAQGRTVVSVLHELNVALLADELVILKDGRITHHGDCADGDTQRALEAVFDQRVQVREWDGHRMALPVV